jgi:cytochrome P450
MTWALFALSQAPTAQSKLRKELLGCSSDNPTMDALNALPYLDAVVREVMRLYPPVPCSLRVAMKDDVLPLNKPFMDRKGVLRGSIRYI